MSFANVPIGELTIPVQTWSPQRFPKKQFSYIELASINQQEKVIDSARLIDTADAPSRARQIVASGDVLVSTVRPNLNAVAVVPASLDGATASTGFTVLRPSNRLDARYLFQWVRSTKFIENMTRLATGASYPAVSDTIVKSSCLLLPPIEEQRRIADILGRADALRAKRREALARLDTLTQSIFLHMFGDARRVSRWPTAELGDLIGETRLGLVRNSKAVGDDFPVPYVRMNAITIAGELSQAGLKRTTASPVEMLEYRLRGGDLLFNTRNSRELVGKSALVTDDRPWIFNNNILRIRLLPGVVPQYVAQLLLSPYGAEQLERRKSGTTSVFAIYYKDLATIIVPLPPMQLQRAFSDRYVAIARLKTALRAQQRVAEQLFDSLQQRAFAGELA
jgi:type I restriction enzyme S subunit